MHEALTVDTQGLREDPTPPDDTRSRFFVAVPALPAIRAAPTEEEPTANRKEEQLSRLLAVPRGTPLPAGLAASEPSPGHLSRPTERCATVIDRSLSRALAIVPLVTDRRRKDGEPTVAVAPVA